MVENLPNLDDKELEYVVLTQASAEVFRFLRKQKSEGVAATQIFMECLAKQKAKIRTYEAEQERTEHTGWFHPGDHLTAANALARIVYAQSSDHLFAFLLGNSPPLVICEISDHAQGAFITEEITKTALKYVVRAAVGIYPSKGSLCKAAANILTSCFRINKTKKKEELVGSLSEMLTKAKDDIKDKSIMGHIQSSGRESGKNNYEDQKLIKVKKAAILCGIVMSGALKRDVELVLYKLRKTERKISSLPLMWG